MDNHKQIDDDKLPMTNLTNLDHAMYDFPSPQDVDPEGHGLIALGGDLDPITLISAYTQGLFPWFNDDEPIAWWCPEPRCILDPTTFNPSTSLRKLVNKSTWQWSVNQSFSEVIRACSLPRSYTNDTWIHEEMIDAYIKLNELGYAHSIEIWEGDELIGGLYGLKIGQIYFGESMFHTRSNASKVAFWALNVLCQSSHVQLIDCQLPNPHLQSLGATECSRKSFLQMLSALIREQSLDWHGLNHKLLSVSDLSRPIPRF